MDILRTADYSDLSRRAADMVTEFLSERPAANLMAATGATPMGLYEELARRRAQGLLDASELTVFQLDEYVGVGPDDPRSLFAWMNRALLRPLGIEDSRAVRLESNAPDLRDACEAYDARIESAGGLDLAILGLGTNGHLGYNEPPTPRDARTREVNLSPESVEGARAYFGDVIVPERALSAGMATLLRARRVLLLVSGAHKRSILARMLNGPVEPDLPASWLRELPQATVIVDEAALGPLD